MASMLRDILDPTMSSMVLLLLDALAKSSFVLVTVIIRSRWLSETPNAATAVKFRGPDCPRQKERRGTSGFTELDFQAFNYLEIVG